MAKTIFLISNNYRPLAGGVVQSLDVLQQELIKAGYQVFIVTLTFTKEVKTDNPNVIRLNCPIRFKYKSNYMAVPLWPTKQLEQLVKQYKPDIFHVHHPFLLGSAALKIARKNNIPIIFTHHTQYEAYSHYIPGPQSLIKKIINKRVKQFCNAVDGIIAPTESMKTIIEKQTKKPIIVIPSAIRPEFFVNQPKQIIHRPIRLLYVGRFVKEKNIPFLLCAVKDLSIPFTFTLVGFGSELRILQNYAFNELKLSSLQIKFITQPTFGELIDHYRNADLFLFSSTTDTQALVLAEAMASGLPIIALNAIGARDIINNGKNGFLVNNENEMKDRIEFVANNVFQYEQVSANALQTAQHYLPDNFSKSVLLFYESQSF